MLVFAGLHNAPRQVEGRPQIHRHRGSRHDETDRLFRRNDVLCRVTR